MPIRATAVLIGDIVKGFVNFEQEEVDSSVKITGEIRGLTPGLHGFHIYQFGDLNNGFANTGMHFNPFSKAHGGPEDTERHVGDLGNVNANEEGFAKIDMTDKLIRLNGPFSIIGRAIAVHSDPDDLGTGGTELSKSTGNSGIRLAAGVIGITQ